MNMPLNKKLTIRGVTYRGGDELPEKLTNEELHRITGTKPKYEEKKKTKVETKKETKTETKEEVKKILTSFDIKKEAE